MPLIDNTYFESIPDSWKQGTGVYESVQQAIERYEPRYLRAAMGVSMYAAFAAGVAAGSVPYFSDAFSDAFLKTSLAPRWDWLINGHTYTIGDCSVYWPGLAAKGGPIECYVYWQWRNANFTKTQSTGGETLSAYENATAASPAQKMVDAWNEMVNLTRTLNGILSRSGLYTEYTERELYTDPESYNIVHYQNTMGI